MSSWQPHAVICFIVTDENCMFKCHSIASTSTVKQDMCRLVEHAAIYTAPNCLTCLTNYSIYLSDSSIIISLFLAVALEADNILEQNIPPQAK